MPKSYTIADLFFTAWPQLDYKKHAEVYALHNLCKTTPLESAEYGFRLIAVLRRLRKNKSLVNKINEEQAVDIYNALTFLNEHWYYFPAAPKGMVAPQPYMARHSFDQFIYADNEYSSYVVTQNVKYLRRLLVTLYMPTFDKENVEALEQTLKADEHTLNLVFFTYAHVRAFVSARCKKLLPSAPKQTEEEETKATPTGAMWLKLKHRLAETPAFQGYNNAGAANMYSALDYLEDLAQQKENTK